MNNKLVELEVTVKYIIKNFIDEYSFVNELMVML